MLKYKLALKSLGTLNFHLTIFMIVGIVYCSVLFARFIKASYAGKFRETTLGNE